MAAYDFDLVCLGSGPAGQRAAVQAAKLGKRAAIVEKQLGDEPFVVACNGWVLKRGLEERVEHVEAGLVGRRISGDPES